MTEPIRILHFADLHVGMENYGRLDPGRLASLARDVGFQSVEECLLEHLVLYRLC